jgi:hypothetical protein
MCGSVRMFWGFSVVCRSPLATGLCEVDLVLETVLSDVNHDCVGDWERLRLRRWLSSYESLPRELGSSGFSKLKDAYINRNQIFQQIFPATLFMWLILYLSERFKKPTT